MTLETTPTEPQQPEYTSSPEGLQGAAEELKRRRDAETEGDKAALRRHGGNDAAARVGSDRANIVAQVLLRPARRGTNTPRPKSSSGASFDDSAARSRDCEWGGCTLRQKLMLVRAPKTTASSASGTLPPGWKKYWKSGCSVQPGLIW